jgi:hypothetical protein
MIWLRYKLPQVDVHAATITYLTEDAMDRYTAFTFVMTLGLGLATGAYALEPFDAAPAAALENSTTLLEETAGARENPAIDEVTPPETEFGDVINGEIINIEGEFFVIKDPAGKEVRVIVDADTLFADGVEDSEAFKAGDTVEAELTPNLDQIGTTSAVTTEDYRHAKSFRVLGTGSENFPAK